MGDDNGWVQFANVLGGGAVGFFSSLFLEPIKRIIYRPDLQVDFPIGKNTNIQEASLTTYLPFITNPISQGSRILQNEYKIGIRCLIKNNSRFSKGESCRVLLTSIETRESPEHEWKQTEYKESNQASWAEPQFRFEAVDIFPWTNKAAELIFLYPKSARIEIQIPQKHFSFNYLFPFPPPQDHGWQFTFLLTGQNFLPIEFNLTLEYLSRTVDGDKVSFFYVNGCLLDIDKLVTRGFMEPQEYADLQKALKESEPIKLTKYNFPM